MWQYDRNVFPPAPKLDVKIFAVNSRAQSASVRAKLDTGASTTVIPERVVTSLNLPPHNSTLTRSFDGSYHHSLIYRIDIVFNGFDLRGISCITARRDDALLGRNVLNRFFIPLDGPNLTFDMK
ncbi:MAG: retroviral-like aspartic protease family protein [bacterium]